MILLLAFHLRSVVRFLRFRQGCVCAIAFGVLMAPTHARANCRDLAELESLLLFSFEMAQPDAPDHQTLAQNAGVLDAIIQSGAEYRLVGAEHQELSSAVVLFLHGLEQVVHLARREQVDAARALTNTPGFVQLRGNAISAYQTVCRDPQNSDAQDFDHQVNLARELFESQSAALQAAQLNYSTQAAKQRKQTVLWMMFLWIAAVFAVFAAHYYLLLRETKQRSRHLCKIPANLDIMGKQMTGHITILGRYGNRFVPENSDDGAALTTINAGIYCAITIGSDTLGAKTMRGADETVGMLFSEPQTSTWVKAQLERSLIPAKLDRVAKSGAKGTRYRLGKGRLVKRPAPPP